MLYAIVVLAMLALWFVAAYMAWWALICIQINRYYQCVNLIKPRFQLVDLLAVCLTLQVPLVLISLNVRYGSLPTEVVLFFGGIYSLVYLGIAWWGAAALSVIQVRDSLRRGLFIGVLQPFGLGLIVVSVYVLLYIPFIVYEGAPRDTYVQLLMLIGYCIGTYLYCQACNWVRAGSELAHHPSRTTL